MVVLGTQPYWLNGLRLPEQNTQYHYGSFFNNQNVDQTAVIGDQIDLVAVVYIPATLDDVGMGSNRLTIFSDAGMFSTLSTRRCA
jgi:hypothetical protein